MWQQQPNSALVGSNQPQSQQQPQPNAWVNPPEMMRPPSVEQVSKQPRVQQNGNPGTTANSSATNWSEDATTASAGSDYRVSKIETELARMQMVGSQLLMIQKLRSVT